MVYTNTLEMYNAFKHVTCLETIVTNVIFVSLHCEDNNVAAAMLSPT